MTRIIKAHWISQTLETHISKMKNEASSVVWNLVVSVHGIVGVYLFVGLRIKNSSGKLGDKIQVFELQCMAN